MTISMYQASVPVITRSLSNLRHLLEKAAEHAEAKKKNQKLKPKPSNLRISEMRRNFIPRLLVWLLSIYKLQFSYHQ